MGRPRKNKEVQVEKQIQEPDFNNDEYYNAMMAKAAAGVTSDAAASVEEDQVEYPHSFHQPPSPPTKLFLVEGKVKMESITNGMMVADQRRIVNAANIDEALTKFVSHFSSLSNDNETYTVLHAGGSEALL